MTENELFARIDLWITMLTEAEKPKHRAEIAESLRIDIRLLQAVQAGVNP